MNPQKRKQISQKTALVTGYDATQVDEIVSCYYNHVQRKLANLDHVNVNVPNLGTFVLVRSRVASKLQRYEAFCETVDESESIKAYETKMDVRRQINLYKDALSLMDTEALRKREVKQKKIESHATKRNQDLEGAQ